MPSAEQATLSYERRKQRADYEPRKPVPRTQPGMSRGAPWQLADQGADTKKIFRTSSRSAWESKVFPRQVQGHAA